jgi:hypothetical protein
MNFKRIWLWLLLAGGLFAFIFFFQRTGPKPPSPPPRILPGLKPAAVTALQITARGQLALRVERTNDSWQLTEPVAYPAQSANVDILLSVLEQLVPDRHFSEGEVTDRFTAPHDYGFADPQATLLLEQPGESFPPLRIGANTAPGDQVFLQVVGRDEIYVVDVNLLKFVPRSPNDWRDTSFLHLKPQDFDSFTVINGNERLAFEQDPVTHLWGMTFPFKGRADNAKLEGFLQALEHARIQQFVSDQPNADLQSLGLEPPDHEISLTLGSNTVSRIQFGKSPTNAPARVYARRVGRPSVVTLPKDLLAPWSTSMQFADYRDPYLLHLAQPLARVQVQSLGDSFSLVRQTNDTWRVLPQDFPADTAFVNEFISHLSHIKIAEFAKDNALETSLGQYGMTEPLRHYILEAGTVGAPAATNTALAELFFGANTNSADLVYARRADENSVYAVSFGDFHRLPAFGLEFRERRFWHFSIQDVTGATLTQGNKTRQLKRNGPHSWSLAGNSQGMIDDLPLEGTVAGLCDMSATAWAAHGKEYRAQFGLEPALLKITLDLKSGDKATVEIANPLPATPDRRYAAVTLEGQLWIFEFPANLIADVLRYLTIP